jgi:hypothetical protein
VPPTTALRAEEADAERSKTKTISKIDGVVTVAIAIAARVLHNDVANRLRTLFRLLILFCAVVADTVIVVVVLQ